MIIQSQSAGYAGVTGFDIILAGLLLAVWFLIVIIQSQSAGYAGVTGFDIFMTIVTAILLVFLLFPRSY